MATDKKASWLAEAAYRGPSGGSASDVVLRTANPDKQVRDRELVMGLLARSEELEAARSTLTSHWEELARFFYPRKQGFGYTPLLGEKRGTDIYDNTGGMSLELLASALQSMLTNPSTPWFGLRVLAGGQAVKVKAIEVWLDETEQAAHETLRNTNFHTQAHELYLDLGHIGTSCMYIGEHPQDGMYFDTRHMSEVCMSSDSRGKIDTIFRTFEMTARQAVLSWGDACSAKVLKDYQDNPDVKHTFVHCVYPRWERDPGKKDSLNLPWASIYIEKNGRALLEESGFYECPYVTPRWTLASGEDYGRSQAMTALPWVKQLNAMEKTTLSAQQLAILPPIFAPDDGFLINPRPIPGSINYYRSTGNPNEKLFPWPQGSKFDVVLQEKMELRDIIRKAFFIDQLQLKDGPQMTATEVLQRTEEQQRLLGPVLGRMHSEFLAPLITRVMGIMQRMGTLPAPPEELMAAVQQMGAQVKVEYVSPIAKSMRTYEGQAIMKGVQAIGVMREIDPGTADLLNTDRAVRRLMDVFGVPAEVINSDQEVKAIRDSRKQAEAAMAQQQASAQQADSLAKLLPAASQAVDPGSIMAQQANPMGASMAGLGQGTQGG